MVKNLPAMEEMRAGSLGGEESLEEEMAAHSSILAWRLPCTEEPGGMQSRGSQRVGLSIHAHLTFAFKKGQPAASLPPSFHSVACGDFSGAVVETFPSKAAGVGSNPGQGTQIPHAWRPKIKT